jgi:hypothetical protein
MYKLANGDIVCEGSILYILAPTVKTKGRYKIVMADEAEFDCSVEEANEILELCNKEDDAFTSAMQSLDAYCKNRTG